MSKQQPELKSAPKASTRKFDSGKFDFIGKTRFFISLTLLMGVVAVVFIATKGFNYGIDFVGGSELRIRFAQTTSIEEVRGFLGSKGIQNSQIQTFPGSNDFAVRFENVQGKDEKETNGLTNQRNIEVSDGMKTKFADRGVEILSQSTVGPQIGNQLKRNSLLAVFYSLLVILIYVAMRFDYNFAPGAVLCLFHDVIITLGILAITRHEINVHILAAVLTIIGYSLNDTIVVFDRIRENIHVFRDVDLEDIINRSINDTFTRSIITSGTTFLAVVALWLFAGGVIAEFAFTMAIGIIFGTYSSIYVAAPLIVVFDKVKHIGQVKAA